MVNVSTIGAKVYAQDVNIQFIMICDKKPVTSSVFLSLLGQYMQAKY